MKYKYFNCTRLGDIRELVKYAASQYANRIAFKEIGRHKEIFEYTYSQLEQDVNAFGTSLVHRGMNGYHIALLGESMFAWILSYLAVVNGLGVVVPLDKELPNGDITKLLNKSDTDVIICSETYAPVVKEILGDCPNIKECIDMNAKDPIPGFLDMQVLIAEGSELVNLGDRSYLDSPIDVHAMCEIIFTSGTTGANKGVMLSHKNIMSVVFGIMHLIRTPQISFSVLPINHSYECTCHVLGGLYSGITLCFNNSLKHLMENLRLFKPGMSLMVPLFLETMYKNIWKEAEKAHLAGHMRYGIWYSNLLRKFGIDLRRLFFKPLLDNFGGNLEQIVCGGAPLRPEIIKGFDNIGINVINGYGITECAPVISTNFTAWKKLDSVGRVLPVCTVRIDNPDKKGNGEIQVSGDIVMLGYYKDEEATRVSFTSDGYFKTGDLGHLDKDRFLYLSGRKKNLIILTNGKNICPEEIEEEILNQIPYVVEVVVYPHAQGIFSEECINAKVYLDQEYVRTNEMSVIKEKLDMDIRKLNRKLPVYKRVQNVTISKKEFDKTTTKKIKRQVALEGGTDLA